jgi:hypothetical protein
MSSPIDLDKNLDPVLQYAPRWARENAARPEEAWDAPPVVERVQEPIIDNRSAFSGDRAAKELFRQLALHPQKVPEPIVDESRSLRPLLLRIGAIVAVAAGIAGLVVVLPGAKKETGHATQSSDSSAGPQPQYSSHATATAAGSQYSSRPVKLVPVEATENRVPPTPSDGVVVASASNTDVPVSPPPPAQEVHPVVADAHAAAAYLARSDSPVASAPTALAPVQSPAPAPVQIPAPAPVQSAAPPATPQKQNDRVQAPPASAPADAQKDVARTLDHKEIATLLDQAETLVHTGDLSGARVLLQRAAEAGSADAALELAGTFDAKVLRELGAIGIAPDPDRARKWYERAAALGSDAAARKLAAFAQANR